MESYFISAVIVSSHIFASIPTDLVAPPNWTAANTIPLQATSQPPTSLCFPETSSSDVHAALVVVGRTLKFGFSGLLNKRSAVVCKFEEEWTLS